MFIAIGILGITNYNNSTFFGQISNSITKMLGTRNEVIPILFAILELISGFLLLISLFTRLDAKFLSVALIIIFIFWGINIIMAYIINGSFRSNFFIWASELTPQLVILSALWLVYREQR